MGVVLVNDTLDTPIEEVVEKAKKTATLVTVNP
jgi:phosphoribosylglycinamide formyltransferase 2